METIKSSKPFKGAILVENVKQVYCRIFLQDYDEDQQAIETAELIAKLLNSHFNQ